MSKKTKLPQIFFLLFLISLFSVFAVSTDTYQDTIGKNGFALSETSFNHLNTDYSAVTRSQSSPRFSPLVDDLDGNGVNEIIALTKLGINIYQNKSLSIIDSYALPDDTYDDMIIYDINNDSMKEIIVSDEVAHIYILQYNGTATQLLSNFTTTSTTEESSIACKGVNDCIAFGDYAYTFSGGGSFTNRLKAHAFNSTGEIGDDLNIYNRTWTIAGTDLICFPATRQIEVADYDNDLSNEYVISYINIHSSDTGDQNDYLGISYVNFNGTDVILEKNIASSDIEQLSSGVFSGKNCNEINASYMFTPPLVFNADGSTSNGLETVIGSMNGANTFEINLYLSSGSLVDTYPEIYNADGKLISNIMRTNIFQDSIGDFCVAGYNEGGYIDFLCGSYSTSETIHTREFHTSQLYNISLNYTIFNGLVHSIQAINDTLNSINPSEFVTPFGIYEITSYQGAVDQTLGTPSDVTLGFESPYASGSILMNDVEKTGYDDMLILTSTNLWYIDDKFVNSQASALGVLPSVITINPCTTSAWAVNTSVLVTVSVYDVDNDDVRARAVLYSGTDHEQDSNWTAFSPSGTTFSFSFVANETATSGLLKLYANDINHNATNVSYSKSFSVALGGLNYGECIETVGTSNVSVVTVDQNANNSLANGVKSISSLTGMGNTLTWLIVMCIVGICIVYMGFANHWHSNMVVGIIAGIELLLFFIGVYSGLLSTSLVVILVIVAIAIIGIFFSRFFLGQHGGG